MGYLLKEALKTLCGVNQWSYAVFWKIGCQNPKLLIWEECYYEPPSYSGLQGISGNENLVTTFHDYNVQTGDKVHLLVNKMMMDNHVNIAGEGLVGRAAFTGNPQWILSENYYSEAHPPEVLKELCQQFSAGMQTVAVIPVLPHGVVQFGSVLRIMENSGFVNDVTSLLLQLGYISGIMLSPNEEERAPKIGFPTCLENPTPNEPFSFDNFEFDRKMVNSQTSFPIIQNELQSNSGSKIAPLVKMDTSSSNQSMNGEVNAEVIPSNSAKLMNLPSSSSSSYFNQGSFSTSNVSTAGVTKPGLINCSVGGSFFSANRSTPIETKPASGVGYAKPAANGNATPLHATPNELNSMNFPRMEATTNPNSANHFTTNSLLAFNSGMKYQQSEHLSMAEVIPGFIEDDGIKQNLGDDLFDVLGADFKNRLFNTCWNSNSSNDWDNKNNINLPSKKSLAPSEIYSTSQGNSESGIFSSDHLLEAVVSRANPTPKPSLDEDVSCKTTVTNVSSSSAPNTSLPYSQFRVSEGELFGVPKYAVKGGGMSSSKTQSGTYSHGSSIYGSQISSWIENNDTKSKQNSSVSTGYSKKAPEETSKTNRKRLKPGENPRPRPKDRQMIQDRVKELREIVPNGAKCSIDALLERTIKHMLFLQSVTKHANKLKQTGESKIISKDGGLLLKDNFEGGATWAYEVGSQSMVCPIIVEDLNQPRQMLVEMLCEERGLFLEIADIIRGLGLTILKGVMETRKDKIWARFAVEANRDVTRMEIFISLVRLLEQSAKSGPALPNGITSENPMGQQFHQIATVPATVGSHSLQ